MRFLVDECTGPAAAHWLGSQGHDVFSAYDQARGASDDALLGLAVREERMVVTNGKDFGEIVFRERRPHRGVILLRLVDERAKNKIAVLSAVLSNTTAATLLNHYVVATETSLRMSGA